MEEARRRLAREQRSIRPSNGYRAEAKGPRRQAVLRVRLAHLLLRIEFDAELLDQLVLGLQKVDVALFARDDLLEQVLETRSLIDRQ